MSLQDDADAILARAETPARVPFTPGPWKCLAAGFSDDDPTVVMYDVQHSPVEITPANGRLIAAAPDLYDQGHRLAMLVLQSDSYRYDPDARAAVDHLLAIKRRIDGDAK